ncbi:uncharacterized protein LOC114017733 [Falco cherrug]|uniref:uncharacterized protein LOC114017733 n=1 Tax=Falco cherrug TaxID=345164 RepID=UPI000FFBE1CD|nr:uncharacterized protein LOC114017733 [Falco cherrug]
MHMHAPSLQQALLHAAVLAATNACAWKLCACKRVHILLHLCTCEQMNMCTCKPNSACMHVCTSKYTCTQGCTWSSLSVHTHAEMCTHVLHTCMHEHIRKCTCEPTSAHINTCIYVCAYMYAVMHICKDTHTCMWSFKCACDLCTHCCMCRGTNTCINVCANPSLHACTCTHVYAAICTYKHIQSSVHTHMCTTPVHISLHRQTYAWMNMCMCTCKPIAHIHVLADSSVCLHTHTDVHDTCSHAAAHAPAYANPSLHTYINVCAHLHTHVNMPMHLHMHVYTWMCTCSHAAGCTCTHMHRNLHKCTWNPTSAHTCVPVYMHRYV